MRYVPLQSEQAIQYAGKIVEFARTQMGHRARKVDRAVRAWARDAAKSHPELLRLGYFGSYARGDWGVGSDLDLVAIVKSSQEPFELRTVSCNTLSLLVPAELLIYTTDEWQRLQHSRFGNTFARETLWVYESREHRDERSA